MVRYLMFSDVAAAGCRKLAGSFDSSEFDFEPKDRSYRLSLPKCYYRRNSLAKELARGKASVSAEVGIICRLLQTVHNLASVDKREE